jgi:hypothetical protein
MVAKQKFKQGLELWGVELRSNNGGVVTLANSLGIFVHANTADRTYTFPNASGTVALLTDIHAPVTLGTANGLSLSGQTLSLGLASSGVTGALSGTDWNTFNSKQAQLNGTGFVKVSGTTVSYDNSTYLTGTKVDSFNTRTGAVTLTSSDVTTALTYTPINKAGDTGIGNLSMSALTATTGTFSGALSATGGNFTQDLNLITAPDNAVFAIKNGSNRRWAIFSHGSETGSNVGSDLVIANYTDAGAYGSTVFSINRANGAATFSSSVSMSALSATTGNFSSTVTATNFIGSGAGLTNIPNVIIRSVIAVSTNTTAAANTLTDYVYLVSGTTTLTLPTAVGNTNIYTIKNSGSNTVTVATTSSQTIDGSLTVVLSVDASITVISDTANWRII